MIAAVVTWALGGGWRWLVLAVVLAAAVIGHQIAAGRAIARATEASDVRWQQALAKQEAEARIELGMLQARADDAGEEAARSRERIEFLTRQIEIDNGNLPNNTHECLDAGRARLLDRL